MGAALKLLIECVDRDVKKSTVNAKGDWRPLVFLMTDGGFPFSDLHTFREAIPEIKERNFGSILACAAGPKAKQEHLLELTDRAVTMDTMDAAAFSGYSNGCRRVWPWVAAARESVVRFRCRLHHRKCSLCCDSGFA